RLMNAALATSSVPPPTREQRQVTSSPNASPTSLDSLPRLSGKVPDFIIGGAMKSGTSTLHHLLNEHPDVFVPEGEVSFFDVDDVEQHADYFVFHEDRWRYCDFQRRFDRMCRWYRSRFESAQPGQMIGEDSTGYLASDKASERIARCLPDAKLVFLLRDPASRSYSHYWHMLRTGREVHDFEDSLQLTPGNTLQRSRYRPQVERYLKCFPREQMMFVLFEEFIRDVPGVLSRVLDFLGLDDRIDLDRIESHRNPGRLPRFPSAQRWSNWMFRRAAMKLYLERNDWALQWEDCSPVRRGLMTQWGLKLHRLINPLTDRKPPPMKPATRSFLNDLFRRENAGLADLIGQDVEEFWFKEAR
ncbi:MAG: sulfotransferase, partial [Planctomycetales bacterium]